MAEYNNKDAKDHTHDAFVGAGVATLALLALVLLLFAINNVMHETGYDNLVERLDIIELQLDCPVGEVFINTQGEEVCLELPAEAD